MYVRCVGGCEGGREGWLADTLLAGVTNPGVIHLPAARPLTAPPQLLLQFLFSMLLILLKDLSIQLVFWNVTSVMISLVVVFNCFCTSFLQ